MGKLRRESDRTGQRLNLELARSVSEGNTAKKPQDKLPTDGIHQQQLKQERLTRTRRVLFTPSESRHLDRLLSDIQEELDLNTLNWSQVTRALWRLLDGDFDPDIPAEAVKLKSPPSVDLDAVQQFDRELATYLYQRIQQKSNSHL